VAVELIVGVANVIVPVKLTNPVAVIVEVPDCPTLIWEKVGLADRKKVAELTKVAP
jgi:hypothetical protein